MKRLISIFCVPVMAVCFLTLFCPTMVSADSPSALLDNGGIIPADIVIDYGSAMYGENGEIYYDILNVSELADAYDIDYDKIRSTKYVVLPLEDCTYGTSVAGIFEQTNIVNVQYVGNVCLNSIVTQQSASNLLNTPVTKTITISATMSNTYRVSAESGVSVEVAAVSNAVGFDVTYSLTVSDSTEVTLQPGESVTIIATPYCDMYSFDIEQWKLFSGTKTVGYGYAYRVIGFCTTVYNT